MNAPEAKALKKVKLTGFASEDDFHTLGLAFDERSSHLYVVNHARAGSRIELFELNLKKATAKHLRTIQHPLLHAPNAISIMSSHEIHVTNDHQFTTRTSNFLSKLETYLGWAGGSVVYVNLANDQVEARTVAHVAFANGIHKVNATTMAVASSNGGVVKLFDFKPNGDLDYISDITLSFFPDNLSISDGKLLIAGHPHLPSLTKFAGSRYICNYPDELEKASPAMKEYCENSLCPSALAEWTEEQGVRMLYSGLDQPASTTGARDAKRKTGIITGLYAKGIFVWRE